MSSTNKKFYSDVQIKSDIIISTGTATTVPYLDASKKLKSSSVTPTELGQLSGVSSNIQTQISTEISDRIAADAVLQAEIDALPDPIVYKGTWDASSNTPALDNTDTGKDGFLYYVSVAGSVDFGAGSISFAVGDKVVNNGTTWDKWDMTDAVSSVFGRTGTVTAQSGDYNASQVTNTPAGTISSVTVQAAINELEGDVVAAQADATQALADAATAQSTIDNHIADSSGAHAASAISVTPAGNLSSTDVQSALEELQSDIDNFQPGSPGDIEETSFSYSNNQAVAANVTGLAFSNAVVRSFQAEVSVFNDASVDSFEVFELNGIQRGSDWVMTIESTGDDSGLAFTITNAGQIQYTSSNSSGFTAGTIKFRAITTSV